MAVVGSLATKLKVHGSPSTSATILPIIDPFGRKDLICSLPSERMAGMTKIPLLRFAMFWVIGTLPYMGIAASAGSVSTSDDPRPAIFAALGLYTVMWTGWFVYRKWWMRGETRLLV
jgi:hypothetical protein